MVEFNVTTHVSKANRIKPPVFALVGMDCCSREGGAFVHRHSGKYLVLGTSENHVSSLAAKLCYILVSYFWSHSLLQT